MRKSERSNPHTGTVTFLFTDIMESTRLQKQLGYRYAGVLATYFRLLRTTIQGAHGQVMNAQEDSLLAAFSSAKDALLAAMLAQRAIHTEPWPGVPSSRVRMGLHTYTGKPVNADLGVSTGVSVPAFGEDVGMAVHQVARIVDVGYGGQILLSQTTRDLVADVLPQGVSLRDLGEHWLRDLLLPQRLFQVLIPDLPTDFPPLRPLA